jgi:hypothetical protein
MRNPKTLSEVLEFLKHADEQEVIDFGKKYRDQRDSIQFVQAKLEYEKRQRVKAKKENDIK